MSRLHTGPAEGDESAEETRRGGRRRGSHSALWRTYGGGFQGWWVARKVPRRTERTGNVLGFLTEAGRGEREVRRPRGEGGQHSWDLLGNNGSRVALGQVLWTGREGRRSSLEPRMSLRFRMGHCISGPEEWARPPNQVPARTPCTADSGDGEPAAGTAFPSDPSARPQPRPQGKTRLRASGHSWRQADDVQCAPRMPNRPPPPLPRGRQFPVLTRLRTSRADFTNC